MKAPAAEAVNHRIVYLLSQSLPKREEEAGERRRKWNERKKEQDTQREM